MINIFQDALFSAIAAIGFASISHPPRRAYAFCALLAAIGHSVRYILMWPDTFNLHIVTASVTAAMLTGFIGVLITPVTRMPAETCLYPALLPMIPGMYAYRCFGALVMCLSNGPEQSFNHSFYLFASNGLTCFFIILGLAMGATLPVLIMKRISFQATRR